MLLPIYHRGSAAYDCGRCRMKSPSRVALGPLSLLTADVCEGGGVVYPAKTLQRCNAWALDASKRSRQPYDQGTLPSRHWLSPRPRLIKNLFLEDFTSTAQNYGAVMAS